MSARTTTSKPLQQVNFNGTEESDRTDRKKRYLTAKYGQHQMNLIKKRLKVEMWMYEQLQELFQVEDCFEEVDIDLDELLDLEARRRTEWLRKKLAHAKQPQAAIDRFIVEVLEQANTL